MRNLAAGILLLLLAGPAVAPAEMRAVCGLFSKESNPYYLHMYQPLRFTDAGGQAQAVAKFKFRTFPDLETQLIVKESRVNNRLKWTYTLQTTDKNGQVLKTGWQRIKPKHSNKHEFRHQNKTYSVQCDVFVKYVASETPPTGIGLERVQLAGGDPLMRRYEKAVDSDAFELFTQMFELPGEQADRLREIVADLNSKKYFRQLFPIEEFSLRSGAGLLDADEFDLACLSQVNSDQLCQVVVLEQFFIFTEKRIESREEPSFSLFLEIEAVREKRSHKILRYFLRSIRLGYGYEALEDDKITSGGRVMP